MYSMKEENPILCEDRLMVTDRKLNHETPKVRSTRKRAINHKIEGSLKIIMGTTGEQK